VLALAACSTSVSGSHSGKSVQPATSSSANDSAVKITSPANGASGVAAGTAIAYSAPASAKTTVTLTAADGTAVAGRAGYDPSTWVPASTLAYGSSYTAKITSVGTDHQAATSTVTFTTMAKPSKQVAVRSFLGTNMVYGDAMPVILQFGRSIPVADRAAVQKRLSVTSSPAQVGAWSWINGHEIHFRPKAKWQPGTQLHIVANTGGIAVGDGYYARNGLTVDSSITKHPMSLVDDDATHTMTVRVDGKIVKKFPTSLGKASTPSSSGNLVMMTRRASQVFDSSLGTGGTPVNEPGGYKELVKWVMQLTWDGQFIHAAPWSVKSQGHRDVSHGCTNVSTANAKWLYDNSLVGTPVQVEHTNRQVTDGDGWTDWNVSWATFIKGSALPVTN
jgi:lipoprotein-anchoring transpeptidase ErfK/SrfK